MDTPEPKTFDHDEVVVLSDGGIYSGHTLSAKRQIRILRGLLRRFAAQNKGVSGGIVDLGGGLGEEES